MSQFKNWTLAAQKALWREIAAEAILRWDLGPAQLNWLSYSSNAVFKVAAGSGEFVLRLSLAAPDDAARLRSELWWLRALRRGSALRAPNPVAYVSEGRVKLFTTLSHASLPRPHLVHGALFEYIRGEIKSAHDLTVGDIRQAGGYLGRLHSAGQFVPPPEFDRPRLDREGLILADMPRPASDASPILSEAERDIWRAVAQHLAAALPDRDLVDKGHGLIHADLLAKNIIFGDEGLGALDFENCAWGYFLYDLAPLLWQLKGERGADYDRLEAALWAGYAAVRGINADGRDLLETMIAARQLASCRWLLQNMHNPAVRDIAPKLLADRILELKDFLSTGTLRRGTPTL